MAIFAKKPILLPARFGGLQPVIEAIQREILTPIEDLTSGNEANTDQNETITGNWEFDGTVQLDGTVTINGATTFASTAQFNGNVGFYSTAPVAQQAAPSTLSMTTISGSGDDASINSNFSDIQAAVNAIKTALDNLGLTA